MAGNDFIAISRQLFTPWKFEISDSRRKFAIPNSKPVFQPSFFSGRAVKLRGV